MSYLSELRKIVGNRPLLSAGATILVFNESDELLFNLRSDTGTWGLPGGSMDLGETLEETARRELYEETGLKAREFVLLDVLSGEDYFFVYPNGDQLYSVVALYETRDVIGELKILDGESTKLEFFSLNTLPVLESRAAHIVEYLLKRRSRN